MAILKELVKDYICKRQNIVQGQIFFHNIWGKYSDNTRALVEEYHRIHPEYILIYEINKNEKVDEIPNYVTITYSGTNECRKYRYSSEVVIDNDWGIIKKTGYGLKGRIICYLYKKTISKKILYISTGHGIPLKKIGLDVEGERFSSFITSTKVMAVSDLHSKGVYNRITKGNIEKIILTGNPRNDVLYDRNYARIMKQKIGIVNKKLILFAPTFRVEKKDGKIIFCDKKDSIENLIYYSKTIIKELGDRFGGEWVIGLRTHPGVMEKITNVFNDEILNANKFSDMADYLCAADVLVTDYSSSMFDYMITKRPCILLWMDEDEYNREQREMYFNKEELPFPIMESFEKFIYFIKCGDWNKLSDLQDTFMKKIGYKNCINASENLINYIDNKQR